MARFAKETVHDGKKSGAERALAQAVTSRKDMSEQDETELALDEEDAAQEDADSAQARGRGKGGWFSGMFASDVDFSVNGARIEGKKDEPPKEAEVVPLFAGAALDLSSADLIGRSREKMLWVEGHHAKLALSPQGTDTAKLIAIEDIWVGLRDKDRPEQPSIIMSTNKSISIKGKGYRLKAKLLYMTEDNLRAIKLLGAAMETQNGKVLFEEGEAQVTEEGVSSNKQGDLFAAAAHKAAEAREQAEQERLRREAEAQARAKQEEEAQAAQTQSQSQEQAENDSGQSGAAQGEAENRAQTEPQNIDITKQFQEKLSEERKKTEEVFRASKEEEAEDEEDDDDDDEDEESEDEEGEENGASEQADANALEWLKSEAQDKLDEIQNIINAWELGKKFEDPNEKEESEDKGFKLPLAEIPILLPFIYAEINLEAKGNLEYQFEKPALESNKELIQNKLENIKNEVAKELKPNGKQNTEEAEKSREALKGEIEALLPLNIEGKITLGVWVSGNASVSLGLAANAGFPGLLMLSAGVMGSVGVRGSGEKDKFLEGGISAKFSAGLGSDWRPSLQVKDLDAQISGGLSLYLGLNGELAVVSPVFDWKKALLSGGVEKELGAAKFGASFTRPGEISRIGDLFSGWYLSSTTLQSKGLMDTFLENHPAKAGFHIFDQDSYEIPLHQAEEVLEEADNFFAVYSEVLESNKVNADEYSMICAEAEVVSEDLSESRKTMEEVLSLSAGGADAAKEALASLDKALAKHQERLDALRAHQPMFKDNSGEDTNVEAFYQKSGAYQDFEEKTLEEESKRAFANKENLLAYEQGREKSILEGTKKDKQLKEAFDKLSDEDKKSVSSEPAKEFIAYYEKHFKKSELAKRKALRGNLGDLKDFERRAWFKAIKEKKDLLSAFVQKCNEKDVNITPPEVEVTDEGGVSVRFVEAEQGKGSTAVPSAGFYQFARAQDKEIDEHLAAYASRNAIFSYETKRMYRTLDKAAKVKAKEEGGKGIISIFTELSEMESSVSDKDNKDDAVFADYRAKNETTLLKLIDKKPEWLFVSGKGIERYEQGRALALLPDSIKKSVGDKTEKQDQAAYLGEIIESKGLIHLIQRAEQERKKEIEEKILIFPSTKKKQLAEADENLKQIEKLINDMKEAEKKTNSKEKIAALAACRKASREFISAYRKAHENTVQRVLDHGLDDANASSDMLVLWHGIDRLANRAATEQQDAKDWEGYRKHMLRLEQNKEAFAADDEEVFLQYAEGKEGVDGNQDAAGKGYLTALKEQHKDELKDKKKLLASVSYKQLLTFATMVLNSSGYRFQGKDTAKSHFMRLKHLKAATSDEEARKVYAEDGGGKGLNDYLKDNAKTHVTPEMLFCYERDSVNELGERHAARLKLVHDMEQSGASYKEILDRYEALVISQSKTKNLLAAFRIRVKSKYEKAEAKKANTLSKTPEEIMQAEESVRRAAAEKHTKRLESLNQMGDQSVPQAYLESNTKQFFRTKKKEIKAAVKNKQAGLTPEERHALYVRYEEERVSKLNDTRSLVTGGAEKLRAKIQEINERLSRITKLLGTAQAAQAETAATATP